MKNSPQPSPVNVDHNAVLNGKILDCLAAVFHVQSKAEILLCKHFKRNAGKSIEVDNQDGNLLSEFSIYHNKVFLIAWRRRRLLVSLGEFKRLNRSLEKFESLGKYQMYIVTSDSFPLYPYVKTSKKDKKPLIVNRELTLIAKKKIEEAFQSDAHALILGEGTEGGLVFHGQNGMTEMAAKLNGRLKSKMGDCRRPLFIAKDIVETMELLF